jgi:hypothetical protein
MKRCFTLTVKKSPKSFVLVASWCEGITDEYGGASHKFRQLRVTNGVSFDGLISAAGQRFKKRSVMSHVAAAHAVVFLLAAEGWILTTDRS